MSFHVGKEKRAGGKTHFRIRFWDKTKYRTLSQKEHPKFNSYEEAVAWCKTQNAKADADRHVEKYAKGIAALEFRDKYNKWDKEVEEFLVWYADEAPNSWESCRCWIQNYVVPYFLGKGLNNPNTWYIEFEPFRRHLEKEARTRTGKKLTYATMGHIVKALNNFIKFLGLHQKMDIHTSKIKCRGFERKKMNSRGREDLFTPEEVKRLKKVLEPSRDFFLVLLNTGMRIHELYSLQFSNVFKGDKDLDDSLKMPYKEMGRKILGYIRLESQMSLKYSFRSQSGKIKRKPLKSKPKISHEFNRIIPITDPEVWDILVENRRRALDEWESRKYKSAEADDYLLFDVDINDIRRDLRKWTTKTPHCCRHTFTTNLVRDFRGVNYGPELIKGITGHTSKEFERYVHLGLEADQEVKKRAIERF